MFHVMMVIITKEFLILVYLLLSRSSFAWLTTEPYFVLIKTQASSFFDDDLRRPTPRY